MLEGTLATLAGLGFFLAGLHMLSEAVRGLAAKRLRVALARFSRIPLANLVSGTLLGALTQSTSAAAFVCIGLLNARAISFSAALTISAWAAVGTSVLVFLASVNLHALAILALAVVGILYLASFHREEVGRRATELLLATGVMLFGLTMLKATGHQLAESEWVREFFTFAAESWYYSFIIGFIVALVMQSSSTVSALAVMLAGTNLIPLAAAVVLVCGANAGSGMSVAMITAHLSGPPRQVALWQAGMKLMGTLVILPLALMVSLLATNLNHAGGGWSAPLLLSFIFLAVNVAGAILCEIFRHPLLQLLEVLAPTDLERQQFTPEFIVEEAAEDTETAFLLARREQAKLVALLPAALSPVRHAEALPDLALEPAARKVLAQALAKDISDFISEAVSRHHAGNDVRGLLLLQRANAHIMSIVETLHDYVGELSRMSELSQKEQAMCDSMSETLHLLLELAAEQAAGEEADASIVNRMTGDRSDIMQRFREEITKTGTSTPANRESLFVATGLFERLSWLVRQLSADLRSLANS